ncbi:MAG: hypothetical protein P8Y95_11680 [Gammaproteobacteria bacterium]
MRWLILCATLTMLLGCDFIGGGETVVKGNDNLVVADSTRNQIARALSRLEAIPEVTDAELEQMYGVVHDKALEGDFEALLVVLRLAEFQRAPQEEEE